VSVALSQREAATAEGIRQLELACLPTSLEWHIWWNEWVARMEMKLAWERAIVDAVTRLQKNQITLARMVRYEGAAKKMIRYTSEGAVWGEETRSADEITREALVWFINVINPVKRDAPEWAQQLFKAVEGCYLQQARLGIELAAVKRRGYLTLNASATKRLPTEKALRDKGMAAFDSFSDSDRESD
jgi:hypothetical protein